MDGDRTERTFTFLGVELDRAGIASLGFLVCVVWGDVLELNVTSVILSPTY